MANESVGSLEVEPCRRDGSELDDRKTGNRALLRVWALENERSQSGKAGSQPG